MKEYQLLDSGNFEKLEQWGEFMLRRPDPQAFWKKTLEEREWMKADAVFEKKGEKGLWKFKKDTPRSWNVECGGFVFGVSLASFKHTGLFPEHEANWKWIEKQVVSSQGKVVKEKSKILNLFGYTGGATLAALKAGGEVTHVDASKLSVARAKENAKISGLDATAVRWIVDDADVFLRREIKRGNTYDGIVLDPPAFGRGAKGEVWKIETDLISLLEKCRELLNPNGFILLNGYAEGYTPETYAQLLASVFRIEKEKVESGKLFLAESSSRRFVLPAGIYARIPSL